MELQRLLIIDDSPDIHELVRLGLADEPLEFFSCATGEEALALAPGLSADMFLLDVELPGLNGFEVCRRLKANPLTADIPVVFLTGASSTEEKLRGLELGAIDYVTKPFDPAELRARVRAALHARHLMRLLADKAITLQESEERFRVLAENSSDAISRHRPDGTYMYVSPASAAILGYSSEELIGRALLEFVHPQDVESVKRCYSVSQNAGGTATISFRFLRRDNRYVWLEATCRMLMNADGTVREIHASARDITERRQMESREQLRADILQIIAQGSPLDEMLNHVVVAAQRQEPLSMAAGMIVSSGKVHRCAPHLPVPIAACMETHLNSIISQLAVRTAASDERMIVYDLLTDPAGQRFGPAIGEYGLRYVWSILIRSRNHEPCGIFSLYRRDEVQPGTPAIELFKLISDLIAVAIEHRQLTDQLSFQACHDSLTQLPNRAMYSDHLQRALAAADRSKRIVGVLLVDVDRFKYINDTYGHQAGDETLCQITQRLRSRLRASDVLARMGGDEFALVLYDLTDVNDAHAVAMSLIKELETPILLSGRKQFVTISVGSAVYPRDAADMIALMKNADLALYQAKDAGRNTVRAYTPDMSEGTAGLMELEGELRSAVGNNELRLHYQPKVDRNGRIVALEALVRWQHPRLGMIPPMKFIPLAEDTGLIIPIGGWVLQEAARQSKAWTDAGLGKLPISVNVSAIQFAQPDFVQVISDALAMPGTRPCLEIELTETLLMRNIRDARDKLAQLQSMNVTVAIDDFGTGYSSLAYLQRLALDTLKIDRSFVSTVASDQEQSYENRSGRIIIGAIVALAKSLCLNVIAEGVETNEQREFLLNIGCDQLQGYLFSPPRPAEQIELLLRKQRKDGAAQPARSA